MPDCPTCGNEVQGRPAICPFCERPLPGGGAPARGVQTLNLEKGRPTVEEALRKLEMRLDTVRQQKGARRLRVIHGYGSSGEGGAIKAAVHGRLRDLQGRGLVRRFTPGERLGARDAPQRSDAGNAGVTLVEV